MTADRFPPTPGLAESAARVGRAYDAAEKRDDATRARKRMEAAAPDMLAALKAAREFIHEEAENRSEAGSEYSDYEREPRELVDLIDSIIAKAEGAA